ncbi:MAG: hypothetical protein M3Z21_04580 [Pseudomonadota bacterium]|nr:hypothetical protein [Pseudomonadota bacterium]
MKDKTGKGNPQGPTQYQQAPTHPGDQAPPGTPGTGEDTCPACEGTGKVKGGGKCDNCDGTGIIIQAIGGA